MDKEIERLFVLNFRRMDQKIERLFILNFRMDKEIDLISEIWIQTYGYVDI